MTEWSQELIFGHRSGLLASPSRMYVLQSAHLLSIAGKWARNCSYARIRKALSSLQRKFLDSAKVRASFPTASIESALGAFLVSVSRLSVAFQSESLLALSDSSFL